MEFCKERFEVDEQKNYDNLEQRQSLRMDFYSAKWILRSQCCFTKDLALKLLYRGDHFDEEKLIDIFVSCRKKIIYDLTVNIDFVTTRKKDGESLGKTRISIFI